MATLRTSADPAYMVTARTLHWITAALVLVIIPAGIAMGLAPQGPAQDFLFHVHRSCGAILIPILLFRVFYRLTHKPAPLPDDIPALQRCAAELVHWLLYILLTIQLFLGWIATSAYRAPILVFWTFELPPIWREDRAFSEQLFVFHRLIGITIALLVCVHIGAALFHHFVRRDRVLYRMLTG
ncbi:MAG: Cytochrome b561 [Pseudorhodoplanes sp.]|nr:Cytochrome b561 [Pseudorhodoplanes sp.]